MFKLVGLCVALSGVFVLAQQLSPKIGRPARSDEIRARNITVMPDGSGLPFGHGTAAEGRTIYEQQCASCHGAHGEGNTYYPALAGGLGTLDSRQPNLTVGSYWPYATTVWDYIHRAMPYQNPGSLSSDQVYSVTAYILYLNKMVGEQQELNPASLPKINMPNRSGFLPDPRPDVK